MLYLHAAAVNLHIVNSTKAWYSKSKCPKARSGQAKAGQDRFKRFCMEDAGSSGMRLAMVPDNPLITQLHRMLMAERLKLLLSRHTCWFIPKNFELSEPAAACNQAGTWSW